MSRTAMLGARLNGLTLRLLILVSLVASGVAFAFLMSCGDEGSTRPPDLVCDIASVDPASGPAPLNVRFACAVSGGTPPYAITWLFGDGASSSSSECEHRYVAQGTYAISLSVEDSKSQSCQETVVVHVEQGLSCTAVANPTQGSAPLDVVFAGIAAGGQPPYGFDWDFGDGAASQETNPSHRYFSEGSYSVALKVTDARADSCRCEATVHVGAVLECEAAADPASGPAPLSVVFSSSASGGEPPYRFGWDFGDGASSTGQNPLHVYAAQGQFSATVTVTDARGVECSSSRSISVSPGIQCSASADILNGYAPLQVRYSGQASGGSAPYQFVWTFGDGGSSQGANPVHIFSNPGTYETVLTVTDSRADTCRASLGVIVKEPLHCIGSVSPMEGPAPLLVSFSSSGSGGAPPYTCSWVFGDGGSLGTECRMSHLYEVPGTYGAALTLRDGEGTECVWNATIVVESTLNCLASAAPTQGGAPLEVSFSATGSEGSAPYTYHWTFGDGGTSSLQNPVHTYALPGNYRAGLTVTDSQASRCDVQLVIKVGAPLACELTGEPASGEAPLQVSFVATPSGGDPPYAYSWSFGDGGASTLKAPSHTYLEAGSFQVVLTVTDSRQRTCSDETTISVSTPLGCLASATPEQGGAPLEVAFAGSATGGALPYAYSWDFGDGGTSSEQNPTHTYTGAGSFAAALTVTDGQLRVCRGSVTISVGPPLACAASAVPEDGVAPLEITYEADASGGDSPYAFTWDFGDGASSEAEDPSHVFTEAGEFVSRLTVTDGRHRTCTREIGISVGPPLTCEAGAEPVEGPAPLTVDFAVSAVGGEEPYSFAWSFGDGGDSDLQNPSHTYEQDGSYEATVVVTDAGARRCERSIEIIAGESLECGAVASVASGPAPLEVRFTGSGSGGVPPYSYAWAFGDGANSEAQNPVHTYAAAGTYDVSLTVTDQIQRTCVDQLTITVTPALECAASGDPLSGGAPLSVSFSGSGTGGKPPYSYLWTFGDGGTSTQATVVHTYQTQGGYAAEFRVTDSLTRSCLRSLSVNVGPSLGCSAAASPTQGAAPLLVDFTATASGGDPPYDYSWVFGDGGTSTQQNPSHTYQNAGAYTATLEITDSKARTCSGQVQVVVTPRQYTLTLVVQPGGSVTKNPDQATYDEGSTVVLTATPSGESYTFSGWSGDASGGQNPLPVLMDRNKSITAAFSSVPVLTVPSSTQSPFTIQLNFTWPALGSSQDHLETERATSPSGPFTWINSSPLGEHPNPYTFQRSENPGTYYYQARAYTNSGYSLYSRVKTVVVTAPQDLTLYASAANTIQWADNCGTIYEANDVFQTGYILVGNYFQGGLYCSLLWKTATALKFSTLVQEVAGRPISRATLLLSVHSLPVNLDTTYKCYAWAGSWNPSTLTWNNAPNYWDSPYVSVNPPSSYSHPWEVDVTSIVSLWLNGTWSNNGFLLLDLKTTPQGESYLWNRISEFYSDDRYDGDPTDRPRILIEFAKGNAPESPAGSMPSPGALERLR